MGITSECIKCKKKIKTNVHLKILFIIQKAIGRKVELEDVAQWLGRAPA